MGPCRLLKTIFAQFLGKYRVVSALFGKIERLTFTGTFDAFQHLVKSHSFKQICFPHRSEMGVLKSFPNYPKYIYLPFGKSQRASEAHRHCRSISSSCRAIANYWGGYALDSSLECGLRSERCKLACLHVGLGQKELAAMAVMAACNCAAANMRKAQPRQRYGLFALLGGKAMSSQKVSPNSAEIVAQLEAGRKGVKAKFCLRFRIASAVLTLLISAAIKLLG